MQKIDWEILSKYLSGEATESDLQEVKSWTGEEDQKLIRQLGLTLEKVDMHLEQKKFNSEKALENILKKQKSKSRKIYLRIAAVAAVIVAIFSIGITIINSDLLEPKEVFEVAHSDISVPEIILADGSKVSLNRGSKLYYPETFDGEERVVELKGEAFFEVTPDKEHAFIVETDNAVIKVLGTSFNVSSYSDHEVEVMVSTGKVEVYGKDQDPNNKVALLPGEKAIVDIRTNEVTKISSYHPNQIAWMTKEIIFNNERLPVVFETIQDVYNVKIAADPSLATIKYTATFEHQDLEYVLKIIELSLNLNIEKIKEDKYAISKNH